MNKVGDLAQTPLLLACQKLVHLFPQCIVTRISLNDFALPSDVLNDNGRWNVVEKVREPGKGYIAPHSYQIGNLEAEL